VQVISSNEPLLFVDGPPVFIRVVVTDEESTSVFTPIMEEELEQFDAMDLEVNEEVNEEVNPSIMRRIAYLEGAFQKEIYQPLQFNVGDEMLTGAIDRIDGDTLFIVLRGTDKEIMAVEINTIEEILWRGKPFT